MNQFLPPATTLMKERRRQRPLHTGIQFPPPDLGISSPVTQLTLPGHTIPKTKDIHVVYQSHRPTMPVGPTWLPRITGLLRGPRPDGQG